MTQMDARLNVWSRKCVDVVCADRDYPLWQLNALNRLQEGYDTSRRGRVYLRQGEE